MLFVSVLFRVRDGGADRVNAHGRARDARAGARGNVSRSPAEHLPGCHAYGVHLDGNAGGRGPLVRGRDNGRGFR